MKYSFSQLRKTAVSVLSFILTMIAVADPLGLIPGSWNKWIALIVGLAGVYGVFRVPNQPAIGQPVDPNVSQQDKPA